VSSALALTPPAAKYSTPEWCRWPPCHTWFTDKKRTRHRRSQFGVFNIQPKLFQRHQYFIRIIHLHARDEEFTAVTAAKSAACSKGCRNGDAPEQKTIWRVPPNFADTGDGDPNATLPIDCHSIKQATTRRDFHDGATITN
jgi:hypothetical protein